MTKHILIILVIAFCFSCENNKEVYLYKEFQDRMEEKSKIAEFKDLHINASGMYSNSYFGETFRELYLDSTTSTQLLNFCERYLTDNKYCLELFAYGFHAHLNDTIVNLSEFQEIIEDSIEKSKRNKENWKRELDSIHQHNFEILEFGLLFDLVYGYITGENSKRPFVRPYPYSSDYRGYGDGDSVIIKCKLLDHYFKGDSILENKYIKYEVIETSNDEVFQNGQFFERLLTSYERTIAGVNY